MWGTSPGGEHWQEWLSGSRRYFEIQAGLAKTRVGGAEISERDANCIVVSPGATSRDVLRLIDLVRSRVEERFQVEMELEMTVW